MWPTEWPGVQMISHSSGPAAIRSPPVTSMSGLAMLIRLRIASEPFTIVITSLLGAPWMRIQRSISFSQRPHVHVAALDVHGVQVVHRHAAGRQLHETTGEPVVVRVVVGDDQPP